MTTTHPWHRRKEPYIFAATVLMAFAVSTVMLGMNFFMQDRLDATSSQVGQVMALYWLSYVIGCQFLRPFSDRFLPNTVLIISTLFTGILSFVWVLVPYMPATYGIAVVSGLVLGMFWPVLMGWLSYGKEGIELNRLMGRFNLSWSAPMILGPYVAGLLSEVDPIVPNIVSGVAMLSACGILGIARHRLSGDQRQAIAPPDNEGNPAPDNSTPLRFPAWIGMFIVMFGGGVLFNVFPVISREELSMAKSNIGLLLLLRTAVTTVCFIALGKVASWHFKVWPMLAAQAILAGVFVVMMGTTTYSMLVVLFCVFGFAMSFDYAASLFHGVSGSPNRIARMAIHESVIGAGMVVGSLVGGWIYDLYGSNALYALTAATFVFAGVMQAVLGWLNASRGETLQRPSHG